MKRASKTIFALIAIVSLALLFFYNTDLFYPKTKIIFNGDKIEVLISRLTTKEELNTIKAKLNEKDIKLIIENAVFNEDHLNKISVKVLTPYGAEAEFSTENMRFCRFFTIELNTNKKTVKIVNDKSEGL